jgi:hypothetical protein
MKKPLDRIIVRVEVHPGMPVALEATRKQFSATGISVTQRLVEWFLRQDAESQAAILGLMPKGFEIDPVKRFLEKETAADSL